MEQLLPLDIPPGIRSNGTTYQAKGRWNAGNFVRFFNGTIQPIGGWTARSLSGATISGVPRAMVSYLRQTGSSNTPVLIVATTRGLYAIVSNVVSDITPAAITTNNTNRTWQLDVFGSYLVCNELTAAQTAGRAYYWTGNTASVATDLNPFNNGSSPSNVWSVGGTPERFLVALGGAYDYQGAVLLTGIPNPRGVQWATQEGGFTLTDWTPSATNTAGNYDLPTDGQVMTLRRGRGQTLIWTTTDLWGMTYIGGDFVYRFDQLGNKCGLISPNAVAVNDTAAFWMGLNGFYLFDGFVKPIPCDVQDYVFGSLNTSYAHLIWALENPSYGEVTWFYPHAAQTEITRYVTYNYRENHWTFGSLARTCGIAIQPGVANNPVLCNASASVFDHETGTARNSEGTPSLTSGPIELGNGDRQMLIRSVIPDDKTVGDVNLTLYGAPDPDSAETTYGPTTLAHRTTLIAKARQVRLKLTEATAAAWRVGTVRLGVRPSSRK